MGSLTFYKWFLFINRKLKQVSSILRAWALIKCTKKTELFFRTIVRWYLPEQRTSIKCVRPKKNTNLSKEKKTRQESKDDDENDNENDNDENDDDDYDDDDTDSKSDEKNNDAENSVNDEKYKNYNVGVDVEDGYNSQHNNGNHYDDDDSTIGCEKCKSLETENEQLKQQLSQFKLFEYNTAEGMRFISWIHWINFSK